MQDSDNEKYIVGFRIDSRYASDFFKFVKNVDITQPFSIRTTAKTVGEGAEAKIQGGILLAQNDVFAKAAFTKDNPNGLPQMKQVKVNGKIVWDKTDQLEFYENLVEKELKPQLPKTSQRNVVVNTEASPHVENGEEVADDLPF